VLKGDAPEAIADAVRAIHSGAAVIAPGVAPALVEEVRRSRERHIRLDGGKSVHLTEREWKILQLLDQGESTTAIASALFVAAVTVRSHISALNRKLEVRGRADAVKLFRAEGRETVARDATLDPHR
jgi:DNA-binding NarL/FixJ family response regulator